MTVTQYTAQLPVLFTRCMKEPAASKQYKCVTREFGGPRVNESFVITWEHLRVTQKVKIA